MPDKVGKDETPPTADKSGDLELSERLRFLVQDLGIERAATVSGKSTRQLMRYCDGAEPQFSVLKRLTDACGASLQWLADGEPLTRTDIRLSIEIDRAELKSLARRKSRISSSEETSHIDELERLTYASIGTKTEMLRSMENLQRDRKSISRVFESKIVEANTGDIKVASSIDVNLFRQIGRLVATVHENEGVRLPADALLEEQANAYNALIARADDPSDAAELESLLPWLEAHLRKRLRTAAAAPGTGKRPAS